MKVISQRYARNLKAMRRTYRAKLKSELAVYTGKTTLLDLLAGRKTQGEESGRILFAGQKPSRPFLKRFTGACLLRG